MLRNWMKNLRDDIRLTSVVMPGTHNAGSYSMTSMSCCQDKNLYEQAVSGVRHFCIRLDTHRGKLVMAHSISKGDTFENALCDLRKAMEELTDEFFILDIREYPSVNIGPFRIKFTADPASVDELLEKYISPSNFAFTDFKSISDVTVGDLRKSGKKYILYNPDSHYEYSVACEYSSPWYKDIFSENAERFVEEILKIIDTERTSGFFCLQTQQTPNPFSEVGMKSPRRLDDTLSRFYETIIDGIRNVPERLSRANVISGDFMNDKKCRLIIDLNNDKGNFI